MWSEMEKYPCAHPRVKTGCNYVIRIVSCNKSPWNTTRAENAFKPAGSAIATATMRDLYSAKPWCVQLNLARVLEDNVYTRTQARSEDAFVLGDRRTACTAGCQYMRDIALLVHCGWEQACIIFWLYVSCSLEKVSFPFSLLNNYLADHFF